LNRPDEFFDELQQFRKTHPILFFREPDETLGVEIREQITIQNPKSKTEGRSSRKGSKANPNSSTSKKGKLELALDYDSDGSDSKFGRFKHIEYLPKMLQN